MRSWLTQVGNSVWLPVKPSASSRVGRRSAREVRPKSAASRLWVGLKRWAQARLALASEVPTLGSWPRACWEARFATWRSVRPPDTEKRRVSLVPRSQSKREKSRPVRPWLCRFWNETGSRKRSLSLAAPLTNQPKASWPPRALKPASAVRKRATPKEASPSKPSGVPRPDLVVRFTTTTGLPPYSAEMPPVMTSMLSTWEGSRLLLKVAWSWSETGIPSTT